MNSLPAGSDELFDDSMGGAPAGPNPLLIIHRALRGRYLLAVMLGALLALPLSGLAYISVPPVFTSRAVMEAKMTLPEVLYKTDLNEAMPAFEAFVSQQASMLQSERVLSSASKEEKLQGMGWPTGTDGLIRLRNSIRVETPRRQNLIILSVSDKNPLAAQAAAAAVLGAYETVRDEADQLAYGRRQERLEVLSQQYLRERDEKSKLALERALNIAGTENLEKAQATRLDELTEIETQIRELTTIRALTNEDSAENSANESTVANTDNDAEDPDALNPARFEGTDTKLDRLLEERDLFQRQLDALLLNATPEHRQAKRLARDINVLELGIANRVKELNEVTGDGFNLTGAAVSSRAEIDARLEDLENQRSESKTFLERIARTRLEVFALQQEADQANTRLEDAEQRLESLRAERDRDNKYSGRIQISQEPEQPLQPSTDRRVPLAGAGFIGGFLGGVSFIAALGIAFPRVRVADDVAATRGEFAMLGMIPQFPDDDDEVAVINVRESFQFLRVILDARTGQGGLVCGITSPTSGDGKTTIAVRLAKSYAAARRRVLLIDADLVGRGASRALGVAWNSDVDEANATLDQTAVRVEEFGFDVIPSSESEYASEVFCGQSLQEILRNARERYDIVLVDTGPILGSIEAAAMTPAMDQILLVVSRGLESRLLRMATERLRELNAKNVGIIFNKATAIDFNRSFAPPSSTSRRSVHRGLTTATMSDSRAIMSARGDGDSAR